MIRKLAFIFSVLIASLAFAATGDIVSVTIRATGWDVDIVQEGDCTAGTYDFALAANNTPGASTPYLTVVSLGFDATGARTTVTRTVYMVQIIRKVYPNQATLDRVYSAPNTTTRVALSDYVYAKDILGDGDVTNDHAGTAPTVTIPATWWNGGGAGVSAGAVTNSSAIAYPKVIGHFAVEQRRPVNGTHDIEVFCVQKYARNAKPVAYVAVTATGATSTHAHSGSATAMTLSGRSDKIPVYAVSLDLSVSGGYTRGELVNINFKAYPWVGDDAACLDSYADRGDRVFKLDDLHWTIMSKMIAVVDPVNGNNTTGVASETQATADAAPCLTFQGALTKIAAANNSAYSLNRVDGGEVQLYAATYSYGSKGTQATTNGYFTMLPHSSTNRAGVVFAQGTADYQYAYMRLKNVTMTRTSNAYLMYGNSTNYLVLEAVNFDDARVYAWYSGDANSSIDALDCTSNNGYLLKGGNDGHVRLIRNYTYTATTQVSDASAVCGTASCILGFHGSGGTKSIWKSLASSGTNNYIFGYSAYYALASGNGWENQNVDVTNVALVNNLIERITENGSGIGNITDGNDSNIILWHNTFAGQRFLHENDIVTAFVNKTFTDFVGRFNSFNSRGDHRTDVYDSDANMIGTWSVGYSVGWADSHNAGIAYSGQTDFWGIRSNTTAGDIQITPHVHEGFTADNSISGADSGNGDYHPAVGSVLLSRVPSGEAVLPYDIAGTARANGGTGSIGAYEMGTDVTNITGDVFHSPIFGGRVIR